MTPFSSPVRKLVVHCSATDDGPGFDLEAIRRYHRSLGWEDIGYHWVLEEVGGRLLLLPGRSARFEGAHCKAQGRNHDSLGLCVVGDFDAAPPSELVFHAAAKAAAFLSIAHGLQVMDVTGHRDWEPLKTCPGRFWNMGRFREAVGHYMEAFRRAGVPFEV